MWICCVTRNLGLKCTFSILTVAKASSGANSGSAVTHLDAVLEDVSRERETFLPVDRLAEDYQLLEEEDPSFLCSGEEAAVLLGDSEGVLLEQFSLRRDLPLAPRQR